MLKNVLSNLKQLAAPYYRNLEGWRTDRKIVLFESDDWGHIRMPSKEVYNRCLDAGYRVDQNPYERYDSLASEEDLELLFSLLSSFKDKNGRSPIITANCLTSNPDFKKIEHSGFKEYYFESISESFRRYPKHHRCLELWKEGRDSGVFFPQCHGREHLNVSLFMRDLQAGDPDLLFGFKQGKPGMIPKKTAEGKNDYQEASNYSSLKDKGDKLKIFLEALDLFEQIFGYRSESFIPTSYKWSPDFNCAFAKAGVGFYQGRHKMVEPCIDGPDMLRPFHLGKESSAGQIHLVRNASFEPATDRVEAEEVVKRCLYDIGVAFRMKKPAIITTHRLNYVGYIDESNRNRNLNALDSLLKHINRRWPEVEFMNSVELGKIIAGESTF